VTIKQIESWNILDDHFRDHYLLKRKDLLDVLDSSKGIYSIEKEPLAYDLVWADPVREIDHYCYSINPDARKYYKVERKPDGIDDAGRSCSVMYGKYATSHFLKKNKIDMVIRSHECVDDGVGKNHYKTWTFHSVPHFKDIKFIYAAIGVLKCKGKQMTLEAINCDGWKKMDNIMKDHHVSELAELTDFVKEAGARKRLYERYYEWSSRFGESGVEQKEDDYTYNKVEYMPEPRR